MSQFVLVPGGTFRMGRGLTDLQILQLPRARKIRGGAQPYLDRAKERPPSPMNEVQLDPFWIGRYPVTQREWSAHSAANPARFQDPDRPIESVTFPEIIAYCNRRSLAEGLLPCYQVVSGQTRCDFTASGYRLPTEAEWEYAARGGPQSKGYIFPGGDEIDAVAWHARNAGNQTHPVGLKQANELGLYDLAGAVWEFCWDWYWPDLIPEGANPRGPASPGPGRRRVAKGGCYKNSAHLLYPGRRVGRPMTAWNDHLGFRLARRSD